MGLKVRTERISDMKRKIKSLPTTVAVKVASKATPEMTRRTNESFVAGVTVYDAPRPLSVDGAPLSLEASGAIKTSLKFVNEGTRIRCQLGPRNKQGVQYGRFLIGKYEVLPNGRLPIRWTEALDRISRETIEAEK